MRGTRSALLGLVALGAWAIGGAEAAGMRGGLSAYRAKRRAQLLAWGPTAMWPSPSSFLQYPAQTELGNYADYAGNYLPSQTWRPNNLRSGGYNKDPYWKDNAYWKYFKKVWGDAPFADANYRLWLAGFFKNFDLPRQARKYQTTNALPAWMHYYDKSYDPTQDPPYESEYALFGKVKAPEAAGTPDSEVKEDCSEGTMQRPCGVGLGSGSGSDEEAGSGSEGEEGEAGGGSNGSGKGVDYAEGYTKLDRYWAKADSERLPANMPPPPSEPPSFGGSGSGGSPPHFKFQLPTEGSGSSPEAGSGSG